MKRLLLAGLLVLAACGEPEFEYEDWWMDSPKTQDPSLTDPSYRVSTRPGLTAADRQKPVIIAVHGFTATTYEWEEFRDFADQDGRALLSLVLLGGHGRNVEAFRASRWTDWGAPILAEYEALVKQGYTNISLVGSSTGGALILEYLHQGKFNRQPPKEIFFIDSIVVPGNKFLTLSHVVGPVLGNVPGDGTDEEKRHWYINRPAEPLESLNDLLVRIRGELETEIRLPAGTRAKIYKTNQDTSADPVSAVLMYEGLRQADGSPLEVQVFDSDLHVFTRLKGRESGTYDSADVARQQATFREMIERTLD